MILLVVSRLITYLIIMIIVQHFCCALEFGGTEMLLLGLCAWNRFLQLETVILHCVCCGAERSLNLQEVLRLQRMNWPMICSYVSGLVAAADYLHQRDILYLLWTGVSLIDWIYWDDSLMIDLLIGC